MKRIYARMDIPTILYIRGEFVEITLVGDIDVPYCVIKGDDQGNFSLVIRGQSAVDAFYSIIELGQPLSLRLIYNFGFRNK